MRHRGKEGKVATHTYVDDTVCIVVIIPVTSQQYEVLLPGSTKRNVKLM